MKKSTIFLLVLVYIASFIIVGLFGIQTMAHNEIYYVESISLSVMNEGVTTKYDEEKNEYKFMTYYEDNLKLQFRVDVLPANATYPGFKINMDSTIATYDIIDDSHFVINVNEGGYGAIEFDVVSNDGFDKSVSAKLMIL